MEFPAVLRVFLIYTVQWKVRGQKKHHHFSIKNVGALKTGRKLFHLFGPQFFSFSNLRKNYRDFQRKLVVHKSRGKGFVRKRAKIDNCFGGL